MPRRASLRQLSRSGRGIEGSSLESLAKQDSLRKAEAESRLGLGKPALIRNGSRNGWWDNGSTGRNDLSEWRADVQTGPSTSTVNVTSRPCFNPDHQRKRQISNITIEIFLPSSSALLACPETRGQAVERLQVHGEQTLSSCTDNALRKVTVQ